MVLVTVIDFSEVMHGHGKKLKFKCLPRDRAHVKEICYVADFEFSKSGGHSDYIEKTLINSLHSRLI